MKLLTIYVFILLSACCYGKRFQGVVRDVNSQQPIPFANVYVKGTTVGTRTDTSGLFTLECHPADTVIISAIGYKSHPLVISNLAKGVNAIYLEEERYTLNEVIIRPTENPAHHVIRQMIKYRTKNDPIRINKYSCHTTTNLAVFLETNRDSNNLGNKSSIPIYNTTKSAINTYDHHKGIDEVQVLDTKSNGLGLLADFQVDGYQSALSAETNFYQNKIILFDKPFYSPIGEGAFNYYRYLLKDSLVVDDRKMYSIEFRPKNNKDLVFKGKLLVDKQTWGLYKIEAELLKSANINYISAFKVAYDFTPVDDSTLYFKSNSIHAELQYNKEGKRQQKRMLKLHKTTSYNDILIGEHPPMSMQKTASKPPVISKEMEHINQQLDSLNRLWWMRALDKVGTTAVTGYFPMGMIDIGPYLELIKRNKVEGTRLTLAARTAEAFSPKFSVWAKVGYGFRDQEWKHGGGVAFKLPKGRRTLLGIDYEKEMTTIGNNNHIMLLRENTLFSGEDNLIASLGNRRPNDRLSLTNSASVWYEKDVTKGAQIRLSGSVQKIRQGEFVPFAIGNMPISSIENGEVEARLRLSFKEKSTDKFLRRYYLGTRYPIINLVGTVGWYKTPYANNPYAKLHLAYKHSFILGLGKLSYVVEAGVIFGQLPFPLLEVHRGNETIGYTRFRFNTINNLQLASDRYASLFTEYHLNGAITNKLPLIKRLNIREVLSAKVLTGALNERHKLIMNFPHSLSGLKHPLMEVGVGLENIFKVLRIEAIYRVTPHGLPDAPRFQVKGRIQFEL